MGDILQLFPCAVPCVSFYQSISSKPVSSIYFITKFGVWKYNNSQNVDPNKIKNCGSCIEDTSAYECAYENHSSQEKLMAMDNCQGVQFQTLRNNML